MLEADRKGAAYYCFCDKDRLASLKGSRASEGEDDEVKEITKYDKHCLHTCLEEVEENWQQEYPM